MGCVWVFYDFVWVSMVFYLFSMEVFRFFVGFTWVSMVFV